MSDDPAGGPGDTDEPMSGRAKTVAAGVVFLMLLAGGFLLLRVSSPAIVPDQVPPAGHYPATCGLCHPISARARRIGTP